LNPTPKEASHSGIPSNPELYILYMPCPPQLLDHYERHLIFAMRPWYNRSHKIKRMGTAEFVVHELAEAADGLTLEEVVARANEHGIWAQTERSLERNILRALQRNERIRFCPRDRRYRIEPSPDGVCAYRNGHSPPRTCQLQ